jgi:hypothetical protein
MIGAACIVGTLIEPVTDRRGSWSRAATLAIGFNIAASAGLIAAGLWHFASTRAQNAASPAAAAG